MMTRNTVFANIIRNTLESLTRIAGDATPLLFGYTRCQVRAWLPMSLRRIVATHHVRDILEEM